MRIDKETLKKLFPNLMRELAMEENREGINSIRSDTRNGERAVSRGLTQYMPDVIDFIRRCETNKQAEEIIDYMEYKGEVEKHYAIKLRSQLKEKGLRSFGPKKEADYYLKHGQT